jgi:enoyl-[acyl-carrier protein] reductase II
LGAQGIQMGTRFLATAECEIPKTYKQALIMADDTDTWVFTNASGIGLRSLKKDLLQRVVENTTKGRPGCLEPVNGKYHGHAAGQSAGLVREILPAGEIIQRILSQAKMASTNLMSFFADNCDR